MMKLITIILFGFLNIFGGILGYLKAGSFESLVMGTCFGCALLGASWGISKKIPLAYCIALLLSIILLVFFSTRFLMSMTFFPSGLMALISLLVCASLLKERRLHQF